METGSERQGSVFERLFLQPHSQPEDVVFNSLGFHLSVGYQSSPFPNSVSRVSDSYAAFPGHGKPQVQSLPSLQAWRFQDPGVGDGLSMAPRYWATGAARSCTTDVMTDGSKLVGVGTLNEQVETALAVRPILPHDCLELGTRRFPGCA